MEVATALLYLEASIADVDLDHPALEARVRRLAARIDEVREGADPRPLESWMEELYRRVSDHQTMGSVVQELRATQSEVEKQIDLYFRDPTQSSLLIPLPAQLSAMRGVLSVLGLDQASQAVVHMRDEVDALAQTEVDPQRAVRAGTFDRLADNLGALSFLIDMLAVQPTLAKSLFHFDAETGNLRSVVDQSARVSAFAAFDLLPEPAALPPAAPMMAPLFAPLTPPAPAPAPAPPVAVPTVVDAAEDDEMRGVFLEEAREVIEAARGGLAELAVQPHDASAMTTVRRAFHTLKGSARMVGLADFGEAAWHCEQLYNARLAGETGVDVPLQQFSAEALDYLGGWAAAIESGHDGGHAWPALALAADALREGRERVTLLPPGDHVVPTPVLPVPSTEVVEETEVAEHATVPGPIELSEIIEVAEVAEAVEAVDDVEPPPAEAADLEPAVESAVVFELDVDDDANAPQPLMAATDTLRLRVPGLPSAADLELGAVAPRVEPALPAIELSTLESSPDETAAAPAQSPPETADLPELVLWDLPPPPPAQPPIEASSFDEVSFELDLGDPAEDAQAVAGAELAEPVRLDVAPTAVPELDFELDLSSGDQAVDAAPKSQTAPSPEPGLEPSSVDEQAPNVALPDVVVGGEPLAVTSEPEPEPEPASELEPALTLGDDDEEPVKVIGGLRIPIPLFNIFLNEADEQSRRLGTEIAEWALELHRAVPDSAVTLAHSLAGNSATVGHAELSALARSLEHALASSRDRGRADAAEAALFGATADEIRRLLHQFAAGFLHPAPTELMQGLADAARRAATSPPEPTPRSPLPQEFAEADDIDLVDVVDAELFPIFDEEAAELVPQLMTRLAEWVRQPEAPGAPAACLRTLHTFKGGARLAGAMRVGEMAHRLEASVERLAAREVLRAADIEPLLARADTMAEAFDALRATVDDTAAEEQAPEAPAAADVAPATGTGEPAALRADAKPAEDAVDATIVLPMSARPSAAAPAIDWPRFMPAAGAAPATAPVEAAAASAAVVRVRAALLDRLVNQAGEVSITRSRLESGTRQLQQGLNDLGDNLDRLRQQLRELELQAETQIGARLEAAKVTAQQFDPLEMDRFTRFQELTRFMAESVNDVATVQRSLQRTLQSTEDELAAQARLTRELQDDLLRTRMVEFESTVERLYRVVRQAAKEAGKQVRLDIVGGTIEVDRGVLERMIGSFEHLLRNAVVHGIEPAQQRLAAGKDPTGSITVAVTQEGNEIGVDFRDDGGGLDLDRIRARAVERGLLAADAAADEEQLSQLIFVAGFTTTDGVTELAGRGVGMDVVRSEVNAMGGRIETRSTAGQGISLRLLLPLTTAVTQVVMLRAGALTVAVPATLIEIVRRATPAEVEKGYAEGHYASGEQTLPFFWLGALLQAGGRGGGSGRRSATVVVIRSAAQRIALHVDEVVGNQEVVVKNLGPQLARLPGLAGITLLPTGVVAPIYNPVALAAVYGEQARERMGRQPLTPGAAAQEAAAQRAPLVLVVDDSLTVRRVTQRLLLREGYRVALAKDGLEALGRLADERPAVLLSDIEMPRMDGFDLLRNVRADARFTDLPVVMITSRIAQKHREHALALGADHYLGKPYAEEELLALVARYAGADIHL